MTVKKKYEVWTFITWIFLALFGLFLIYPMFGILKQSVISSDGRFTFEQFGKFFSTPYYSSTIQNSFVVTIAVTAVTLLIGIPFAYFYSFFQLKGSKFIFVVSILCCMSAPFIGAYSWIMLLGRNGVITVFLKDAFGIRLRSSAYAAAAKPIK